ncbi:MAG: hypothetical protein HC810_04450 [Acaryochloridaceae cyanobacterium RL_2_7]|nr:hypothetical protein [Acaryochloridaceae cyanobacterium RL_2_7]
MGGRDWLLTGTAGTGRLGASYKTHPLRAKILALSPDLESLVCLYPTSESIEQPADFNPVGMSYVPQDDSSGTLYVVNDVDFNKGGGIWCFHLSSTSDSESEIPLKLKTQNIPYIAFPSNGSPNSIAACRHGMFTSAISIFLLSVNFCLRHLTFLNLKELAQ